MRELKMHMKPCSEKVKRKDHFKDQRDDVGILKEILYGLDPCGSGQEPVAILM
jgi:hypothetical protein